MKITVNKYEDHRVIKYFVPEHEFEYSFNKDNWTEQDAYEEFKNQFMLMVIKEEYIFDVSNK